MEKDTKHTVIAVAAVFAVIIAVFAGIFAASGVRPPQTVVESESMQHGIGSQIGVIDTADMIILRDKNKVSIRSFVDGYSTGYRAFGSYGDVIVYDRGAGLNAVIHRAILWLDNNGNGTWSAPSLKDYPSDRWSCTGGTDCSELSGRLTLRYLGHSGNVTASINLDDLADKGSKSGFITMGDNNSLFDQPSSVSGVNGLISYEQIKSVAWIEVPWVGVFNMALNENMSKIDKEVPNTVPCLAAMILLIIFLLAGISFIFDQRYYRKYRKILCKDMNAPAPSFPVEKENR